MVPAIGVRRVVLVGVPREVLNPDLLGLCDEFFRHASPAVHTELRRCSLI